MTGAPEVTGVPEMPADVAHRLADVRERMAAAARSAGRAPDEVRLLLATKTMPAARILAALRAGETLVGENRVQEVVAKAAELSAQPHELHFIGHLQVNKVNALLPHLDCLQTLDSVRLGVRLQQALEKLERTLDVLVQVNVSGEGSKSGIPPGDVPELLAGLQPLDRLVIRGFMTIGLNSPDLTAVRTGYRELARLRDRGASGALPGCDRATELSMGMSNDYPAAIAEGATIVRVGSAVFGERIRPAGLPGR